MNRQRPALGFALIAVGILLMHSAPGLAVQTHEQAAEVNPQASDVLGIDWPNAASVPARPDGVFYRPPAGKYCSRNPYLRVSRWMPLIP